MVKITVRLLIPAVILFLSPALFAQEDSSVEIVKYNNPKAVVDLAVGLWAQPIPLDYDHDGKTDLLVSCSGTPYNGLYFFKNISNGHSLLFDKGIKLAEGIKNLQVSYNGRQLNLTVPGALLKNFTTSFGEERSKVFPVDSIVNKVKKIRANQWKLVDFDGDGDLDLLVGAGDWGDYGWDNAFDSTGQWKNGPLHGFVFYIQNVDGHYVFRGKLKTVDNRVIDVFGAPSPNLVDFDNDGDLDLICGEFLDKLTYYENIGTRQHPVFAKGRYLKNSGGVIKMPLEMINPVAFDWDNDGHVDLIIGQEDGRVAFLRNTGTMKEHIPIFESPVFFQQKAEDLKFGVLSTPFAVDWDSDGKEDIICGNSAGNIAFIKNLGGYPPKWAPPVLLTSNGRPIRIMAGRNGSIQGPAEAKWGYTTLSVADWDGDGKKDLIVNSIWGKVIWFKNIGSKQHPTLSKAQDVVVDWAKGAPKPAWNWWKPGKTELVTQWRTTPLAIDWNKDGLMDLVMLDHEGYLSLFERRRKNGKLVLEPGKRIFYGAPYSGFNFRNAVTDSSVGPLRLNTGASGSSGRRKFCIADWNGDGKPDLLVNSINISLLKNKFMSKDSVVYRDMGELSNVKLAGHTSSPTIVDWNKDKIPDLLIGAEDGHFYYLENPRHKTRAKWQ